MLSAALAVVALLSACSKKEAEVEPLVTVQAAAVKRAPLEQIISSEAVLAPVQQSAVTPKISAPVRQFYVNRGSRVHKGQLLATLENSDLVAAQVENKGALDQAQAAYESTTQASLPEEMQKAEADVHTTKQALDAEQKLFTSREDLYKQGALPRKDLDQARVSLTQAQAAYDQAQRHLTALQQVGKQQQIKSAAGQLESARGKYMGSEAQLSYTEVRSPIDGVVTERPLYPGEMATAGTPLITIMDTSKVIAKAHIPQEQATKLKVGDAAQITPPGSDQKVPAKITVISPATDPNSTTIEIWALANNKTEQLKPGTTVQLGVVARRIPDALTVPASAVLSSPDTGTAVMVVGTDDRAHRHAVQLGVRQGDQVQVVSGLQPGDRVITTGAYGLPDNTRVRLEGQPTKEATTAKDSAGG
jgi:RND family efflux transporter MFP subunit